MNRQCMLYRRVMAAAMLALTVLGASQAAAQGYSADARRIALGGVGGDLDNVASRMIDEQRPYGSLVVPFGVFQLLSDFNRLNPSNDAFDPVRTFEYAASPLHYINGRGSSSQGNLFIQDLVNGRVSIDLARYRGFTIANNLEAEGLVSPTWGKTIRVAQRGSAFQGIFIGAGPYLPFRTALEIDGQLRDVLAGELAPIPNGSMRMNNRSDVGVALAITGGYRARVPLPIDGAGERDGLYLGVNYHHLRGFQYRGIDSRVRFDTNAVGLIVDPVARSASVTLPENPLVVNYRTATSGTGFAIDTGIGVVVREWEAGFGLNGIGNRINWSDFELTRYSIPSLLNDVEFREERLPADMTSLQTTLPVNYSGNLGYNRDRWSAMGNVVRGFNGTSLRLGYERRMGMLEGRAGGHYLRGRWHPSGGIGFNLSPRVGLDVAAFTTTANIERKRKLGMAMSFRFNH